MKHKQEYAKIFSEGNKSLERLLLKLWDNEIKTIACCSGHTITTAKKDVCIFGIKLYQKEVSHDEWMDHMQNTKYNLYTQNKEGYISIDADNIKNQQLFIETLKNMTNNHVSITHNMISIHNYVNEAIFFDKLSKGIDEYLEKANLSKESISKDNHRTSAIKDRIKVAKNMKCKVNDVELKKSHQEICR